MKNSYLKKFSFRFIVVLVIFFGVKLTINQEDDGSTIEPSTIFYFITAFILTMFTWEVNDWLIRKQLKEVNGLDLKGVLKIVGLTFLFLGPTAAIFYYLGIYQWDDICEIAATNKALQFRIDWLRAILLGSVIIVFNLLYFSIKQKKDLNNRMNLLEKELITSKYAQLKNQISPHFLFNSLNTLTSLMYEDRDLASDFVTRLASTYRYILENKEENVVSLKEELNFLDSFIFMMNVRHEGSIVIETNIGVESDDFCIPTLSLQMLVENAIKHNFFSKEKPLAIKVYTVGKIALVVQNTLRKRQPEESSTKVGLDNIRKRYSYYTTQEMSVEEHDTAFTVTMPLINRKALDSPKLSIS